jgi:two-component system, cell cycle response regulator
MDWLVRMTLALRETVRRLLALSVAGALSVLVATDATSPAASGLVVLLAAVWAAVLFTRIRARFRAAEQRIGAWHDLEIGMLLVVGTAFSVQRADGGLSGPLYPLLYVLVALVSAFAHPLATAAVVAGLIGLEAAVRYGALAERAFTPLVVHAAFIAGFALLNMIFLRAEIARIRLRARARLEAEISGVRDAARSYRLLGTARPATEGHGARADEERLVRSSVEEIHEAVLFALELLRRSLGLHTAILLWRSEAGTHARISEVSTLAENIAEGPYLVGDGIIGAVLVRAAPMLLEGLKPGYKLPYYAGACPVRSVCGVPVMEHGAARGVLITDRADGRPFLAHEIEQVAAAGRYIARAIQNERLFVQLERAKVEQGKLYRAAEALGAALTEADVVEAGVKSARAVALFDFAAVTLFDEATRTHEICAVSGDGADALVGARFAQSTSLCAMVVQNRHSLPYRGDFDPAHQVLFSRQLAAPAMPSILVLPLLVHERPLGTLVLGAKRKGAFGDAVRPTLEVLASHMAVSLANARMVRKLEEMATTDGLTGLLNKRALLDIAQTKVAGANRFARRLSVLITDIDLFKRVNDTHGHDIGDVVIRGMADILRRAKRATDAIGRFGGEEFVLVCEETDAAGAMLLAERVRKEVESKAFATPEGPLYVTCSVGIATFPEAGRDWEALFKAADDAMYCSKRSGRNRSTAWAPVRRNSAA